MKQRKMIICTVLILVFAYVYAHVAKTNLIYDKKLDSSDYIGLGIVQTTIEQEFICKEDNLDAIAVKCQLLGAAEGTKIHMILKECASGAVVATVDADDIKIENGKFHTFSFETVSGCRNKCYRASFEIEGAAGLVIQPETQDNTKLIIGGEEKEGTLILKTVTNRFDVETYCVLLIILFFIIAFFRFLNRLFSR